MYETGYALIIVKNYSRRKIRHLFHRRCRFLTINRGKWSSHTVESARFILQSHEDLNQTFNTDVLKQIEEGRRKVSLEGLNKRCNIF